MIFNKHAHYETISLNLKHYLHHDASQINFNFIIVLRKKFVITIKIYIQDKCRHVS